jgi:hypothetical protein
MIVEMAFDSFGVPGTGIQACTSKPNVCCPEFRFEVRRPPSRPNKSLQPTATAVMPPAAQEIMPAAAVAEH